MKSTERGYFEGHWTVGHLLCDGLPEPGEHDLQHLQRVDEALQQRHRL